MRAYTLSREASSPDLLWLLQHTPVFTQGQAGLPEHILHSGDIPVVQSDRGGQVTYHGPGQLMVYCLFDLKTLGCALRSFIQALENIVIDLLNTYGIEAHLKEKAPGVYVAGAKICSLGLRLRKGYSYHGLSLNVNMDLAPFDQINPCGFQGLRMTQIADFVPDIQLAAVAEAILPLITQRFFPSTFV